MASRRDSMLAIQVRPASGKHRNLFELVESLRESLQANEPARISSTLAELQRYAETHFPEEELLLPWDKFGARQQDHDVFRQQVMEMSEEVRRGGYIAGNVIVEFLRSWLRQHVPDRADPQERED